MSLEVQAAARFDPVISISFDAFSIVGVGTEFRLGIVCSTLPAPGVVASMRLLFILLHAFMIKQIYKLVGRIMNENAVLVLFET